MSWLAPFRRRLIILALLIVLPAFTLVLYENIQQRRSEVKEAREGAIALSQIAAATQQSFTKNTHQLLVTLTQFPFLLLATNKEFAQQHLINLRKLSPDYFNFGLVETNGDVFCSAEPLTEKVNIADRGYFRRALQTHNFAAGEFQVGRFTGKPCINFGYPVLDERGALRRVLYASLKLEPLSEALARIPLPDGAAITVIDRKGTVLAREPAPEKWVGQSFSNSPVVRRILEQRPETFEMPGLDGEPRLHAVTAIRDGDSPGLFVSVGIPLTTGYAEANADLALNLAILGAVAGLVWLAARRYASRYFLEPVGGLVRTARKLAEGDLSARTGSLGGVEELDELGRAFDEMAERLQKRQEEVKQAQEQNQKLNQDLERRVVERTAQFEAANKELEAFSYSVSHDLRAPLRHISGFVELLRRKSMTLDEEGVHFLKMISDATVNMGRLVDDLLSFSRMARAELRLTRVDLDQLVQAAKECLERELNGRMMEWQVHPLPVVSGDSAMLRVALDNLLGNAVKYTRPRNPARIEIGSSETDREHVIFVRDNGVGFNMTYADKLFGVFQRLHHADEFEGTGIGLATVQRIVAKMGGRVWAESKEGEGATFYFAVPKR